MYREGSNLLEEIRKTRERLHKQLKLKSINSKEVLEISRELDKLILEYYRSKEISFDEENDG
jgi:hypothetical protein